MSRTRQEHYEYSSQLEYLQWIGFEDKEGYHNVSANNFSNKILPIIIDTS
ncbi:MAG: hypothetical protein QOK90_11315 [Nitrososphaeraceae archaeon]|nr:hypothetical protein [Nitrososphaeraceae archaeon]